MAAILPALLALFLLAAALGEVGRAGKLAWQATLDARLAWGMSESPQMRAEAAAIGGAASALIARLAARERR